MIEIERLSVRKDFDLNTGGSQGFLVGLGLGLPQRQDMAFYSSQNSYWTYRSHTLIAKGSIVLRICNNSINVKVPTAISTTSLPRISVGQHCTRCLACHPAALTASDTQQTHFSSEGGLYNGVTQSHSHK